MSMLSVIASRHRVAAGGGGPLVHEDFEGTGAPSGWTSSGTVDWDNASPALEGSKSFHTTWGGGYAEKTFTASDEIWMFLAWRMGGLGDGGVAILDSASANVMSLYFGSDGRIYVTAPGVLVASASGVISANTKYYFWMRYKKGTGSNGGADIYVSPTTTKPGSPAVNISNHTGTQQADRLRIGTGTISWYDNVVVSDTVLGSNPF